MEFDTQIKDINQDEINEELINKHLELIPYPQPLDFLSKPENTMFTNLFYVIKLNKQYIQIDKLKESILKSLNNHKGLLSTFILKKEEKLFNNGIYLNYEPKNEIKIEEIKIKDNIDKTELEELFQHNLEVFKHFNSPQINIKIFYNNCDIYLFIDICHTVLDGASISVFFNSINNAYLNKELPKDYFLYYLYKYNKEIKESPKYKEDLTYFQKYFIHDKDLYPKYNNSLSKKDFVIIAKTLTWDNLRTNLTKYFSIPNSNKITNYNIFLLMNIILANYLYSNMDESHHELNFTFSGRDWKREKYSVGCLSTDYPVYFNFDSKGKLNMKNFYNLIKKQLELKNNISRYPYFHSDKGRLPVIIQREKEFLNINNFCGDNTAKIIYDFTNKFNNKCNIFWSPLSVVMTIGDNLAKYDIMADGSKYNEENIKYYKELIEKSGKFIFNNMDKINSDDIINIEI